MAKFKIADHMEWNSEAGHVTGVISKIQTGGLDYKGHTRRASESESQYEIESDETDHVAANQKDARTKID